MTCCNHNCREGRDCPDRAVVTPEEAESWVLALAVSLAVFAFACFCAVAFLGAPLSFPFN
jgi:hypothetical protein